MAGKKWEIITSGIMILALVILFVIDIIKHLEVTDLTDPNIQDPEGYLDEDPLFHLISIIICTLIYFTIFFLHIKRLSALKWKMIVVATFVAAIIIILLLHFTSRSRPPRWDLEFRLLFGVDIVVIVVFLMLKFMQDTTNTILVAILATIPVSLFIDLNEQNKRLLTSFITVCILAGAYLIIVWLYVKKISNRRLKVVPILAFVLIIIIMILIGNFQNYNKFGAIFDVLITIDASSAFVLGLWMYVRKAKAWRSVYMEQEILESDEYNFLEIAGLPTRFTLHELNAATGNFETPIGMGGSGAVFKGVMGDGPGVAV